MSPNLMLQRVLLTLAVSVLGLLVPFLEYSPSHIFNPDWPGHARLHNVWQIITNSTLSAAAAYFAWTRTDLHAAARLGLVAPAAFLLSYFAMGLYGGSMVNSDGTELKFGSLNASLVMMLAVAAILGFLSFRRSGSGHQPGLHRHP